MEVRFQTSLHWHGFGCFEQNWPPCFQSKCRSSHRLPKAFHDAKPTLNDSIFAAKESTEYLASMFTLKQPPRQCQAEMDSSDMNLLYRQFEKASVALWACQASGMTESISDSTKQADTRVMEFLQHFETLVCSIDDVKERLLNQCESQQKGSSDRLTTEEDTIEDVNLNHSDDVRDYEDSGALSFEGNVPSKYPDDAFGNKTVVFSCSGRETIQKQDKNHNQSDDECSQSTACFIARHDASGTTPSVGKTGTSGGGGCKRQCDRYERGGSGYADCSSRRT